jgi:hypothetical protein
LEKPRSLPMRKVLSASLLLVFCFSCELLSADQMINYNITKGDPKVKALEACGDYGTCFSVDLSAPGNITSIEYSCEGEACGWVHPCPDGGKCNLRANEFEISGNTAIFYGWTNSGNPKAVYKFTIHYQ